MSIKTVGVTGGLGYVGARLVPELVNRGYQVKVIDLGLYGKEGMAVEQAASVEYLEADLRDPDAVSQFVKGLDAVIHLAAISNDPTGDLDEVLTRQVNFDAVGMLVGMARQNGVKRFINASSSSVFGVKEEENITENLEPEPISHYSRYKMLSEWIVGSNASDEFVTVNIRPATICGYSPRQRFDLTVNKLTIDGLTKKVITVHGGQQRRPNVGMTDIVNLYCKLLESPADQINGRTFNFGFENLKVIEIAELIQSELQDLGVEIKVTETFDQRDYHISSSRVLEETGYETISSIKQEVAALRKAFEEGKYGNPDAEKHYNMKSMKLDRNNQPYKHLSR